MWVTSTLSNKRRKFIEFTPTGNFVCHRNDDEGPENGPVTVHRSVLSSIEYEIGDKVKIIKDWKDWELYHGTDSCVGKVGIVTAMQQPGWGSEGLIIQVEGDNFKWWYYSDDLCPAEMEAVEIPKKKLPRVIN